MHGIRKNKTLRTSEEISVIKTKVTQYKDVTKQVFDLRKKGIFDESVLKATANILRLNPDFSTLWNYRRETILKLIEDKESQDESKAIDMALAKEELKLTQDALQKNPKSYPAWFQREWILNRGFCALDKELGLCSSFLDLDERNFHCWNYRRIVAKKAGVSPLSELNYSTQKINQNFSNYSAFHYRTRLLANHDLETIRNEVEMVKQAVFTEPDDQSAWFYHRWLVRLSLKTTSSAIMLSGTNLSTDEDNALPDDVLSFLLEEIEWLKELLAIESESKWTLSAIAFIYSKLSLFTGHGAENQDFYALKCEETYNQLKHLDPDHSSYYEDMISRLT